MRFGSASKRSRSYRIRCRRRSSKPVSWLVEARSFARAGFSGSTIRMFGRCCGRVARRRTCSWILRPPAACCSRLRSTSTGSSVDVEESAWRSPSTRRRFALPAKTRSRRTEPRPRCRAAWRRQSRVARARARARAACGPLGPRRSLRDDLGPRSRESRSPRARGAAVVVDSLLHAAVLAFRRVRPLRLSRCLHLVSEARTNPPDGALAPSVARRRTRRDGQGVR